MGKRKKSSRKPLGPKKKEKLPTNFQCLFCNHENSVTCKLDKKAGIGALSCKVCGQTFQTTVNNLSAPVDVYADWMDACDDVAKEAAIGQVLRSPIAESSSVAHNSLTTSGVGGRQEKYEADFVVDDETAMDDDYGAE